MKRYLCFVICVLLFAGCTQPTTSNPVDEMATTELNILVSLDEQWENQAAYDLLLQEFGEQHPSIKLVPSFVFADTEAILKLLYANSQGQKFDLAIMGAEQLYSLLEFDLILTLDDYILQSNGLQWLENRMPYTMGNATYEGKIWSLPLVRNSAVVHIDINRTGPVENPLTLEKLATMLEQQPADKRNLFAAGGWNRILARYTSYTQDIFIQEQSGYQVSLYSPEKSALLQRISELYQQGSVLSADIGLSRFVEMYEQGKLPILVTESQINIMIQPESTVQSITVPLYLDDDTTFSAFGSNGYLLDTGDADQQQAAWSVLRWLSDNNTRLQAVGRSMPLSQTMQRQLEQEAFREGADTFTKLSAVQYNSFDSLAVYQQPKISKMVESTIQAILYEGKPADESLQQLQHEVALLLKEYRKEKTS